MFLFVCDKVCQCLATCWLFSPGTPISSANKTDLHDITEILLKVAVNTIEPIQLFVYFVSFEYLLNHNFSIEKTNQSSNILTRC